MWGLVAVAAGGIALLSANVSALAPDSFFAVLHNSRSLNRSTAALDAQLADVGDARAEIARLSSAQKAIEAANVQLASRLDGVAQNTGAFGERVSALEGALPRLVKTLPIADAEDSSLITGSIGTRHSGFSASDAEPAGGSSTKVARLSPRPVAAPTSQPASSQPAPSDLVSATAAVDAAANAEPIPVKISSVPPPYTAPAVGALAPRTDAGSNWFVIKEPVATTAAPSPQVSSAPVPLAALRAPALSAAAPPVAALAAPSPDVKAIGVALGAPVQPAGALAAWQALAARVGVLLVGTSPLLAEDPAGSGGKVLVAGPIGSIALATKLCADINRAEVTCMPMPYVGSGLTASPTAGQ